MKPHHHIMRRLAAMFAALVLCALLCTAQTKPDLAAEIQRAGNATINAPQALSRRNNNELNRTTSGASATKPDKERDDNDSDNGDNDGDKEKVHEQREPSNFNPPRQRTSQQTIQSRSVGYRIQAYSDNNGAAAKVEAQKRARAIALKFPQYRTYLSYNAPSWRLRLGDFRSHGDAQSALAKIRAAFPAYGREMVVVRDHINVWQ